MQNLQISLATKVVTDSGSPIRSAKLLSLKMKFVLSMMTNSVNPKFRAILCENLDVIVAVNTSGGFFCNSSSKISKQFPFLNSCRSWIEYEVKVAPIRLPQYSGRMARKSSSITESTLKWSKKSNFDSIWMRAEMAPFELSVFKILSRISSNNELSSDEFGFF